MVSLATVTCRSLSMSVKPGPKKRSFANRLCGPVGITGNKRGWRFRKCFSSMDGGWCWKIGGRTSWGTYSLRYVERMPYMLSKEALAIAKWRINLLLQSAHNIYKLIVVFSASAMRVNRFCHCLVADHHGTREKYLWRKHVNFVVALKNCLKCFVRS